MGGYFGKVIVFIIGWYCLVTCSMKKQMEGFSTLLLLPYLLSGQHLTIINKKKTYGVYKLLFQRLARTETDNQVN